MINHTHTKSFMSLIDLIINKIVKYTYLTLTPEMLRTPLQNAISITCFGSERVKIIILNARKVIQAIYAICILRLVKKLSTDAVKVIFLKRNVRNSF